MIAENKIVNKLANVSLIFVQIFFMAFEIMGRLLIVYEIIQRSESFRVREFVIENSEEQNGRVFTNYIKFQCTQDKTTMPDRFSIGDEVKVLFNLKGNKWARDGKESYFTNLDAWRMEHVKLGEQPAQTMQQPETIDNIDASPDDLPF